VTRTPEIPVTGVETNDRNRGPRRQAVGAIRRAVRHPSDVDAFERHYNDVHIPLARQYPALRRYTRSRDPAAVIGEPCYTVAMPDWDDMATLEAGLGSEVGQRTAGDATANLARYAPRRTRLAA
jgi:uncharacterized protein (TIGR02118 family)